MNIGPGPDGDWDPVAYSRLQQIGSWIKVNGEGIYNSTSVAPYSEGSTYYTKAAAANTIYAFVTSAKDAVTLPAQLTMHLKDINKIKSVTLLGTAKKVKWKADKGVVNITIPAALQNNNGLSQAAVFKVQY